MLLYTGWSIRQSREETAAVQQEFARESDGQAKNSAVALLLQIGSITGGLALLALGARWLVDGAVTNAKLFGVSDLTIGLTIVAAGTSLPEVATSGLSSIEGERGPVSRVQCGIHRLPGPGRHERSHQPDVRRHHARVRRALDRGHAADRRCERGEVIASAGSGSDDAA
ncbi:MAG: hypothetical protein KJZ87_10650, partial [Thermoguttaceae bacterium]|nr:hypothetical protein [Thermoguttaceae bacterium]